METQLGLFEGEQVKAATLKLKGASDERIGKMVMGEEIFLVVKAHIEKIAHGEKKVGGADLFTREHTGAISAMYVVDRVAGERMLSEAAMIADEQFGIANLFKDHSDEGIAHLADTNDLPPFPDDDATENPPEN